MRMESLPYSGTPAVFASRLGRLEPRPSVLILLGGSVWFLVVLGTHKSTLWLYEKSSESPGQPGGSVSLVHLILSRNSTARRV